MPATLNGTLLFPFDITWTSLTSALRPVGFGLTGKTGQLVPAVGPTAPALKPVAATGISSAHDPGVRQWEMVLPKMERPAAAPKPNAPLETDAVPHFTLQEEPFPVLWWRRTPVKARIAALAVLLVALAVPLRDRFWRPSRAQTAPASADVVMGETGWITEWASDTAGSRRARQLSLYRPSLGLADYQLKFAGQIAQNSLGWVCRAADSRNYYAMKLEVLQPGPRPTVAFTRFAVREGVEGTHFQRILPLGLGRNALYHVRLDATGPRFSVSIEGETVDVWTNEALKRGAIGFFNEREERGLIRSLHIALPQRAGT